MGCDLVAVREVSESIAAFGDRYLNRVYTPAERRDCSGIGTDERFAGRFAAKEAAAKILRPDGEALPWNTIEIVRALGGAPGLQFHRESADLALRRGIESTSLSISHTGDFAMAVVVATYRTTAAGDE